VTASTAGALAVELLERLEQPADFARRDHGAGVGDRETGTAGGSRRGDQDPAAGHVVPDGVVDQVGHQAFGQIGVPGGAGGGEAGLDAHTQAVRFAPAAVHHPGGHLGEVERFPAPQPALTAGQGEQRVDEPFLLLPDQKQLLAGGPQ
jgi:hypothetical protein